MDPPRLDKVFHCLNRRRIRQLAGVLHTAGLWAILVAFVPCLASEGSSDHSVARVWNEELLEAIRNDFARPTVHARNLFHTAIAMWDAWAAYDLTVLNYLHQEKNH